MELAMAAGEKWFHSQENNWPKYDDDGGCGSDDHDDDDDDVDDYNDDVIGSSNYDDYDELSLLFFLDLKCCCEQNMLVLFV